jgi:hypothetical protein
MASLLLAFAVCLSWVYGLPKNFLRKAGAWVDDSVTNPEQLWRF